MTSQELLKLIEENPDAQFCVGLEKGLIAVTTESLIDYIKNFNPACEVEFSEAKELIFIYPSKTNTLKTIEE